MTEDERRTLIKRLLALNYTEIIAVVILLGVHLAGVRCG